MKVLMIHPHDLYSPMEPWTIRIKKFAEELVYHDHTVTLAYFPMKMHYRDTIRGVYIIPLNRKISIRSFIKNTAVLYKFARTVDIIHLQKAHFYASIPAILAALMACKPLHYDWDDREEKIFEFAIPQRTPTSILVWFSFFLMEHALPFLADSVSVSSELLRKLAVKRGANERKVVLIPVGADLTRFHFGRKAENIRHKYDLCDSIVVFYHGQLHSCQYVKILLQAFKLIEKENVNLTIKFMIAGSGSDLEALRAQAIELGLEDKVLFTDFIPYIDIPEYIAAADICVAPFEDNKVTRCKSPLKIAEYMAAGKPIVASDVGEVRNMLGDAGLLVQPGSPGEMAKGILKLAVNPELRYQMSMAARKRAEYTYNWRNLVKRLEKVYTP